jgi:DNA-binding transcriptional regulator YdaS (Cro superfamily)
MPNSNVISNLPAGISTAKVLDISYPYASHISTGRRRLSPILCHKIKKATNGKFDFENITVLKK